MKNYGGIQELLNLVFRDATTGKQITLQTNSGASYSADRVVSLPSENAASTLVSRTSTDTLTNKSISGASNTITNVPISTGISGLGTSVATFLATPSSANLAAALTDETGSGAVVFATSPILVTPNLGTPSAVVLTSATGLPVSTGLVTSISGSMPAAGILGETITSGSIGGAINVLTGSMTELGHISLTAGVWNIIACTVYNGATGNTYYISCINATTASQSGNVYGLDQGIGFVITGTGVGTTITLTKQVSVSTTTSYYLNCTASGANAGVGGVLGSIRAIRIG